MYLQAMANRHSRGITNAHIGTTLTDPNIDYATVAKGFGAYGEGPITAPKDLGPALRPAAAVVNRCERALLDDAADIHALLRSLPGRRPPKDFALLNQ